MALSPCLRVFLYIQIDTPSDVLKAIRNMEPAWEKVRGLKFQLSSKKVNGLKFQLVKYQNKKGESRPCYQLTKT